MRIEQLTFTRFIAAIVIFIFHYGRHSFPFNLPAVHPFFEHATVGVSYFFILSGFVMTIAYSKSDVAPIDVKKFYVSRFARIYPVYIIVIIISSAFAILKHDQTQVITYVLDVFALQTWLVPYALEINYTAWSVSAEIFFYLLFPFFCNYIYRKYSFGLVATGGIIFWIISQIFFNVALKSSYYQGFPSYSHCFLFYHPLTQVNEFILGNVTGLYFLKYLRKETLYKNYDALLLMCPVLLLVFMYFNFANYHNGLLAVVFVPFILLLSLNTGRLTKIFSLPIFILLGEISYSIYILQQPVFQVCKMVFLKLHLDQHTVLLFYFAMAALLLSAYLSSRYIEIPLQKYINKKFKKNIPVN